MGDAVILEEQLQRLALVVENKPGVLARVSCIFHRYNSNIHRLLVKPSRDPELSLVWMEVVLADAKTQIICKPSEPG